MPTSDTRHVFPRAAVVLTLIAALCLVLAAPSSGAGVQQRTERHPGVAASRGRLVATLDSVGTRYVRERIPVKGYTAQHGRGRHKLVLQRFSTRTHRWFTRAVKYVRSGGYRFPAQYGWVPGKVRLRTVLYAHGRRADVSKVLVVRIIARPRPTCASAPSPITCPKPAAFEEHRSVDVPDCPQLLVTSHEETRTVGWAWDASGRRWAQDPGAWAAVPGTEEQRPAGVGDCVDLVGQVPADAVLPDLRIKDLTKCGAGDMAATGGTCFKIVPSAPYDPSFPQLAGEKLLKFGVITLNVGAGRAEIIGHRASSQATEWSAYQNFYDADGTMVGSTADPAVQFYFAGDGHNHWHIRDFDDYQLLDSTGTQVAVSEKHGYCIQDNTTYTPMYGTPGVPPDPVYTEEGSCGHEQTDVTTIVHGLSVGWGDTYPTSLPNQAIDITGLPDGEYTVRVHADALGSVTESNENNNVAEVNVQITGDTVTVVPGTSTGGLG